MGGASARRPVEAGGVVIALALVAVLLAPLPAAATSSQVLEARLLELVNAERSQAGLPSLELSTDLVSIAQRWSSSMAAAGDVRHNPDLAAEMCCRLRFAENVAWGGAPEGHELESLDGVHRALMASPAHRDNVLNPVFDQIGIGIAIADGVLYVTEDFRRQEPVRATAKPKAVHAATAETPPASAALADRRASRATAMLVRIEPLELQMGDVT